MAAFHATLTLNGAAQNLHDALYPSDLPSTFLDKAFRSLRLQGEAAGAAIAIGGDATVTLTSYGLLIVATSTTPLSLGDFYGGAVRLSDIWVFGTNTQKLHIFGVVN